MTSTYGGLDIDSFWTRLQVDESTPFAPTVKGEIGGMGWHNISELPATSREATQVIARLLANAHVSFHWWAFVPIFAFPPLKSLAVKDCRLGGESDSAVTSALTSSSQGFVKA